MIVYRQLTNLFNSVSECTIIFECNQFFLVLMLQPQNVLVVFHNSVPQLKLADFGSSRMFVDELTECFTLIEGLCI